MPPWQAGAPNGPGRMVPDVAANADPDTGYDIVLDGETTVVGGTSAVAPLYAGLFAAFGTKLGFVTPELMVQPDLLQRHYQRRQRRLPGWRGPDPCTGLGSPIGTRLERNTDAPGGDADEVAARSEGGKCAAARSNCWDASGDGRHAGRAKL